MRICALALVLAVAANAASLENVKSTNELTPQAANTKTEQTNHVETKTTSTENQVKPSEQTNSQHYEKADLLRARKKRRHFCW